MIHILLCILVRYFHYIHMRIQGDGTKAPLGLLDKAGRVHVERRDRGWEMKVRGGAVDLLVFDLLVLIFVM